MREQGISYTRVSGGEQVQHGTSLADQERQNRLRAEEMGVDIVACLSDEGVSGELYLARPEIQKVLRMLEAGEAKYLFVTKIDRQGRDTEGLLAIRKRVRRCGAEIIYSSGQQFANDSTGDFTYTVMAGMATFEKKQIVERTQRGLRSKVRDHGQMVARLSPYGYHIVTNADIIRETYPVEMRGKYILIEETADIARWIYHEYDRGVGIRGIADALNKWLVPTPKGGVHWSPAGIHCILKNPVYKGRPAYGKRRNVTDESRYNNGLGIVTLQKVHESEWLYMDAPAIVSNEVWERAQIKFQDNKAKKSGNPDKRFLLTGFLFCKNCGRRLGGVTRKGKGWYVCRGKDDKLDKCTNKDFIPSAVFDAAVMKTVVEYAENENLHDRAIATFTAKLAMEKEDPPPSLMSSDEFQKTGAKLDQKEALLIKARVEAMMEGENGEIYVTLIQSLRQERTTHLERWKLEEGKIKGSTAFKLATAIADKEKQNSIIKMNRRIFLDTAAYSDAERRNVLQCIVKSIKPEKVGISSIQMFNGTLVWFTVQAGIDRLEL